MRIYGKIENNKLIIVGNKIQSLNGGTITNPRESDYIENGYMEIRYAEKPEYDYYEEKLEELVSQGDNFIGVWYNIVPLTDEEYNSRIKEEIAEEESNLQNQETDEQREETQNKIRLLKAKLR